ncbi:formylglycine-generating enzyme family protein [Stieleria varia]|uniref:Serine/threonine-protein kinase pkn1 n=1 Tax=Stieleria varia TaxID=2528005 RepID=A0A5C5ZZV2_9BACT|nr:SUMF1/EgtB/PvdO family nonheme iron enzyme [Stieleria varia]TWT92839.1 Serine/threonine-protein kinase pkn1 [Stieleria varia]
MLTGGLPVTLSADLGFEPAPTDDHPVVNVSWNDAVAFCAWLSQKEGLTYRLPTEAEWEFSCRAGSDGRFAWGDDATQLLEYGWCGGSGTHPVGRKKPNAFGLFDMHGNVFEWCADHDTPYGDELAIDPIGSRGSWRTKRGGSWRVDWMGARNAYRTGFDPTGRHDNLGFRVVRVLGTDVER